MGRWRSAAIALALAAFATACDGPAPYTRILLDGDPSAIKIMFRPCDTGAVRSVALYRPNDVVYDLDKSDLLWSIEASPPDTTVDFEVGSVPLGFVEKVQLNDSLKADDYVAQVVTADGRDQVASFTLAKLTKPGVLLEDRSYDLDEALRKLASEC